MAKISTLIDTFDAEDTDKWTGWGAYAEVVDGALSLTPTTGYDAHLTSAASYDLTDSAIYFKVLERPYQEAGNNLTEFDIYTTNASDAGDAAGFVLTGDGNIGLFQEVNGGGQDYTWVAFNPARPWLRLRHSGGKLYYEDSADGQSWGALGNFDKRSGYTITSVDLHIECGYWGSPSGGPGLARLDNVNTLGAVPAGGMMAWFAS